MKFSIVLLVSFICFAITSAEINLKIKNTSLLVEAIHKAISEVIVDFVVTLNVISVNDNYDSNDFRDELIKEITRNPVILVRQQMLAKIESLASRGPRKSCVTVLRSFPDFLEFHAAITTDNFDYRGLYILVLVNGQIDEIERIFEILWRTQIYNANVIYATNQSVSIVTFLPFQSSSSCSNSQPILINEFTNGNYKNDIKNFFPIKTSNLQQCEVRVATSNISAPYIYMKTMNDGTKRLYGRDYDFIQTLAQTLNFRINFTYAGKEGYLFTNGSAGGSFLYLMNNDADLAIADYWLKPYRVMFFDASSSYISEKLVFVVPRGSELSSIEKLLYPLTFTTWLMLITCFVIGYFVIFIIKLQSRAVQNFVFGTNVKYPYMNMWIGLLGTIIHRMPGRNFARFILTIFLLFSIIMRTAYQGKMYHMIQSNKKHMEPQTIDEMSERDFTLHILNSYFDLITDRRRFRKM